MAKTVTKNKNKVKFSKKLWVSEKDAKESEFYLYKDKSRNAGEIAKIFTAYFPDEYEIEIVIQFDGSGYIVKAIFCHRTNVIDIIECDDDLLFGTFEYEHNGVIYSVEVTKETGPKKYWARLGVSLILSDGEAQDIKDGEFAEEIIENALYEGRFEIEGETYFPDISENNELQGVEISL